MALFNTADRWGAIAKLFHWLIAILVFAMIALGLAAVNAPLSPTKLMLFTVHKLTGLTVFVLMILRLIWRLASPVPILPPGIRGWEKAVSKLAHWLLYAIILAMPVSGYVITSAANFPVTVFGLFDIPLIVRPDKELQEDAEALHYLGFLLLSVLLLLHVAAALRHHFVLKDDILRRMLPGA